MQDSVVINIDGEDSVYRVGPRSQCSLGLDPSPAVGTPRHPFALLAPRLAMAKAFHDVRPVELKLMKRWAREKKSVPEIAKLLGRHRSTRPKTGSLHSVQRTVASTELCIVKLP